MIDHTKWVTKILGNDFFESLQKTEIYKPQTRTNLDSEEIAIAYKIVPRLVLNFLVEHLKPMFIGHNKEISLLPLGINGTLSVSKQSKDVYSGEIVSEGRRVYEYQYRSIPGIGIILLTTFEMYDMKLELEEHKEDHHEEHHAFSHIDEIIEERLKLNKLISEVVERKLSEKEALERLVTAKLAEVFLKGSKIVENKEEKMERPSLKDFLHKKSQKREHSLQFLKNDIDCPDCGVSLYKKEGDCIRACICYGFGPEDKSAVVGINKSEDKITFKFSKKWDQESIDKIINTIKKG